MKSIYDVVADSLFQLYFILKSLLFYFLFQFFGFNFKPWFAQISYKQIKIIKTYFLSREQKNESFPFFHLWFIIFLH